MVQLAPTQKSKKLSQTLAKNSVANMIRLGMTSIVAILLPAYLTKHLPVKTYSAWVLVLQLGAYVSYLDFGVQTAVAKYIAEYEAKRDISGCGRAASAGLVIMLVASAVGLVMTALLAWRVPELFGMIPASLLPDVRISVLLVGSSLSIVLAASVFSAIFLGLQRYRVPMATVIIGRLVYGAVLCWAVYKNSSLAQMGVAVAAANILSAVLQIVMWKRLAGHVRVSLRHIDGVMLKKMLGYCGVLTIWSACMLIISGIDVTVVGHYDFAQVAYYSVASTPVNFVLSLIGALLGPLLPATSALSVSSSPEKLGELLLRTTRLTVVFLLLTGLPIFLWGNVLLKLWVGDQYAVNSIGYLRILLAANIIRNFCGPYSTMVVATSNQRLATASGGVEAAVNLVASILLARSFGAWGVAFGTLIGAVAGVAMHFSVSMLFTKSALNVSRMKLLWGGLLKPTISVVPSILFFFVYRHGYLRLSMPFAICCWLASTVLLMWFFGVGEDDRRGLMAKAHISS